MTRGSIAALAIIALTIAAPFGSTQQSTADTVLALERAALERWYHGDPQGYLDIYDRDVTYFDPFTEKRVDGLDAMTQLLAPMKGMVDAARYEMIAPHVRRAGDAAILTYNVVSYSRRPDGSTSVGRWNCTAVYGRVDGRWKILHNRWSLTRPELKGPNAG